MVVGVGVVVGFGPSGSPLRRTPLRRTPLPWTTLRRTAQIFALFIPSPTSIFALFCLSLGVFSLNFGGVFEGHPKMCTFLALGLSCETKASSGAPGLHTTTRELQTCTFQAPALQTPPKFHEKTPREGKKSEFFGPPTLRDPTVRGPTLRGPTMTHTPDPEMDWPKLVKSGWPKRDWPKSVPFSCDISWKLRAPLKPSRSVAVHCSHEACWHCSKKKKT